MKAFLSIIILIVCGLQISCGVKGSPLPPLTPPVLGRGEPNFSKATENLKLKKKKNSKIEGDFDEPATEDFPESSE